MDIAVGFVLGMAVVAPIGPISLLLVALGLERGRGQALRAGLGVAGGDVVLIIAVLGFSSRLMSLDPTWQRRLHIVIGLGLLAVAVHGLAARGGIGSVAQRIRRPFSALLLATLVNPMTLSVWLGMAVVIGAKTTGPVSLALHGVGLVLATIVWHAGLGTLAGSLGPVLGSRGRLLQRLSAAVMLCMSITLLV